MALDYRQRINELAADNPYAAEYGYPLAPELPSPPPDISHLLIPLDHPPAPEGLEEPEEPPEDFVENPDAPDISHLLQPVGPVRAPAPAITPAGVNTEAMGGLGPGINTAANAFIRQPLAAIGQGVQQFARDPLGTLQAGDQWHPSNLIQSGLQKLGVFEQTGPEIQTEAAAERGPSWTPEQPIGPIKRAGEAVTEYSKRPGLQPAPGWEGGLTDAAAGAFGTTGLFLATGVLGRGAMPVGALMGSYMAAGEAYDEAVRQGATPEQIKKATRIAGVGGATEPLPIEVILNRIPMPLWGKAIGIFGRILAKGAAEGGQEVVQQGIQNFSEKYAYNPDQDLTEGMAMAFGLGSIVGGTFAGGVELAGGEQPVPLVDAGAADAGAAAGAAADAVPPSPSPGEEEDEDYIPPLAPGPGEDEVEDITGLTPEEQATLPGGAPAAPAAPIAPAPPAPAGPAPAAPAAPTQPGLFDTPAPPAPGAAPLVTPPEPVSPGGPTRDELRKQFTDHMGVINTGAVADHVADTAQQALSAGRTFTLFPEKGKAVEIVSVDRGMVADAKGQRWGTMPLLMAPGNDFPVFQVGPPIAAPAPAAPLVPQVQTALDFNQPLPPAQAELPLVSAPPSTLAGMIAQAHGRRQGAPEKWTPPPPPPSSWAAAPDIGHLLQPIGTRRRPEAPQFAGAQVDLKAGPKRQAARNARIGHYRWQPGVNVGIEVPAAGERRAMPLPGVDQWSAQLPEGVAYGRIKGTRARRTEVKAFIGPHEGAPNVFLIDQVDPVSGNFDEPKVMLDFATLEEARDAYISSYSDGRGAERIGSISQLSAPDFKKWLASKKTLRPFDRKATAEARRQRKGQIAADKQAANVPQVPEPEAAPSEDQGIPGGEGAAVQPAEAEAGVPVEQEEAAPSLPEGQAAPQPVTTQPVETQDAQAIRSDQGQAQQEDVVRPGAGARGEDLQRQAPEQPSDRAPQREERPQQQEVATLSNDSAPARQSSKYKYLGRWSFFKSRPLGGQAQEHVLKEGRASGVEVLFALDANGKVLSNVSGVKDECPLTQELSRAMRDPGNSIALHHNHPEGRSLSPADVALMAHAGANSIWAHGHDGTVARAAPTAALRKLMGKLGIERRKPQLIKWITVADEAVLLRVQTLIDRRTVSYEDGNRFHAHLVNVVLHNAGLIDYHANIDATAFIAKADLGKHLDIITGTVAKLANVSPRTDGRYNNRSAPTLRHRGEVGTAFGPTEGMAGQRGREEPVHKARPEGAGRKAEPAKVAPPPAPLSERWDKLSLEQKEKALSAAKVSRSPITAWKNLGEANQQKLLAMSPERELVAETVQEVVPGRISTRLVTAKKELKAAPDTHEATITAKDVDESQNAGLVGRYLGMGHVKDAPAIEQGRAYVEWQVQNLLFLYHAIPKAVRAQSKRWYAGANTLSRAWADMYELPVNSVSGVLAVLSPQKDWFQNASLAQRIIDINKRFAHEPWTPAMTRKWNSIGALKRYKKIRRKIGSKTLAELTHPTERALWIRIYDETYLERSYRSIHPSGKLGEFVQITKGPKKKRVLVDAKVTWGSLGEISKADAAYHSGGDIKKLSALMGNAHKVRNFYNNINVPWDKVFKDVTIDTHAVAAAHLQPFSGKSPEVSHILGTGLALPDQFKLAKPLVTKDERYMKQYGKATWKTIAAWKKAKADTKGSEKPDTRYDRWHRVWKAAQERQGGGYRGPKGSAKTGVKGTYGYGAEAYRIAAERVGILPREMQSITWEAIRSIFSAASKRNPKFVERMRGFWRDVDAGKITAAEARQAILDEVGGAKDPGWFTSPTRLYAPGEASTYAADVYRPELVRGEAGRGGGPGRGASAEAAAAVEEESVQERRPFRAPDPAASFTRPEEKRVLTRLREGGFNVSKFQRNVVDREEAFGRLMPALKATGRAIPNALDIQQAASNAQRRGAARGDELKRKYVDPLLEGIAKTGLSFEDFSAYAYAKHATEVNADLRAMGSTVADPSGMSDAEAAAILAGADPRFKMDPDFDALAQKYLYPMNKAALRMTRRAGLIDKDTYRKLHDRYQFWVPFRGWETAEGDDFFTSGRGYDVRGPEWKTRGGRESRADSPLAYSILNANAAIARSEKNRVGRVLGGLARMFPHKEVWEINRYKKQRYLHTDKKTGAREIRERWLAPQVVDPKRTIVFKEDGVPYYLTIHDEPLLIAMQTLGAEEVGTILRNAGKILQFIGKLFTTYNPAFAIFRNPIRDLQTAMVHIQEEDQKGLTWDVLKTIPSAMPAMNKYLKGTARPPGTASDMLQYAHDFALDGGKIGWMDIKTIEEQKRELQKAISPTKLQQGGELLGKVLLLERIERANGVMENAVRLALYVELRKRGVPRAKAALSSAEVTTNFNTKGVYGQAINSLYLFFNARVQGAARVIRFLGSKKVSKTKKAAILGTLPALGFLFDWINYLAGGDDDDGLNRWDHGVPQYDKEKNFILLLPGGNTLKIPMSFGYNSFFVAGQQSAAVMRNMLGMGKGVEPAQAAFNMLHSVINATSPVDIARGALAVVPTLGAPFAEMYFNSNYQGAPIYPTKYDPKTPDADLHYRGVGSFWKAVAKDLESFSSFDPRKPATIDVSPESLEHLANTYFGGAGQFWMSHIAGNAYELARAGWAGETPDIELPRDVPLLREFAGSSESPYVKQNLYYEVWDKADLLRTRIEDKEISRADAKRRFPVEYKVYDEFELAQKKLREERERRKKIDNNTRLSATERKRRLDAIEDRMAKIRSGALKDYGEELQRSLH